MNNKLEELDDKLRNEVIKWRDLNFNTIHAEVLKSLANQRLIKDLTHYVEKPSMEIRIENFNKDYSDRSPEERTEIFNRLFPPTPIGFCYEIKDDIFHHKQIMKLAPEFGLMTIKYLHDNLNDILFVVDEGYDMLKAHWIPLWLKIHTGFHNEYKELLERYGAKYNG